MEPVLGLRIVTYNIRRLVLLATLLLGTVNVALSDSDVVYKIGVVPQFNKSATTDIWQKIVSLYESASGYRFTLIAEDSFESFEKSCAQGVYDFVYLNPLQAHLLWQRKLYKPIAKDSGAVLQGIVVVRNDSSIESVKDLAGQEMVFSTPNAFGASLVLRSDMASIFNIKVKERYVQNQSSVYRNVMMGLAVAGGGVQKTLSQQPIEIRKSLRVIYQTVSLPSHAFAVRTSLPDTVIRQMQITLLEIGKSEEGRSALLSIPVKKIDTATENSYDGVAELRLENWYQGVLH